MKNQLLSWKRKSQKCAHFLKTLDIQPQIEELEAQVENLRADVYRNLTRWQRVQIARHPDRPYTLDYLGHCFSDFVELHGDRAYRDDPAIVGGLATLNGTHVMVVGHQKGRDTKSNLYRNFGMPNPEGYRKAFRLFETAERFGLPIVCLLDTPGAFPGLEAEERGQAEAIAKNLLRMSTLKVPVVIVVIGEGASGGALGIGIGNTVMMLENSWYSVIAPESCSSILWRSWEYKEQAAEALKLGATDLLQLGIIDTIIPEPIGGAHRNPNAMFSTFTTVIQGELLRLATMTAAELVQQRREKFYAMGVWTE